MILNTNGNVGINFATPRNLLHLDGGTATAAYSQFTNSVTGNGASTSGLRVGVDANGDGNVFLQNNRDILFTTDGNPRMRIFRDGQVGIGNYTSFQPRNDLHQHVAGNNDTYHQFSNGNTTAGSAARAFRIGITYASPVSNAELRHAQPGASIRFLTNPSGAANTNASVERMAVQDDGNLAIGNYTTFTARNLVHQHINSSAATYHQFTNSVTGAGDADQGFRTGINASGDAQLYQFENLPMRFYTNNAERITISASGNVGINTTTPGNRVEINSATAGASGLRFSLLNSSSAGVGTITRALTVDPSGDVVLGDIENYSSLLAALAEKITVLEAKVKEMERVVAVRN